MTLKKLKSSNHSLRCTKVPRADFSKLLWTSGNHCYRFLPPNFGASRRSADRNRSSSILVKSCIYWTFGTCPIRTERRFLYGFLRIEWIRSKRGGNCCNCICQSYRGKTSSANQFLGTPHRPFPLGSGDRHRLLLPSHSYCSRGRHRAECGLFRIL